MAAQFPGAGNAVPDVYAESITLENGVSVPAGVRLPLIMGEGAREERLVSNANGDGNDGFAPDYSGTTGSDGRHFLLGSGQVVVAPVVENRTRLFKNGIELQVVEDVVDETSFESVWDARVDPDTGQIELQAASLVDQGGEYYRASDTNTGNGTITNLSLIDENAPPETWTIRCSSIRRDGYGNPVDGYAQFIARGSVSGVLLDGYGNQITWQSNGTITDNTVLRFAIVEGTVAFREGDTFIIQTQGGALVQGDDLDAIYISQADINDPELFTEMNALAAKHGAVSLDNRVSLGGQLAFANGTPGVFALQAAPSIPRRVSYSLVDSANGETDIEELTFALPLNVTPDANSKINFFVTNPSGVEEQITPNKVAFYDPTITSNPSSFIYGETYSYTVILDESVQKSGEDGVLTVTSPTTARLSSATVEFGIDDRRATRSVEIVNATNAANNGTFSIVTVQNGDLTIFSAAGFVTESSLQFQVLDSATSSARILFTEDLALGVGDSLRATVVDERDADFFDAGWLSAYEAAEKIEVDMVVPLPSQTISVIFQNGKIHVETMSTIKNKKERMLFIGAIAGLTPSNVTGQTDAAVEDLGILEGIQGDDVTEILAGNTEDLANYSVQNAYGDSFRVVYFYPDQIVVQVGSSNELIDGFFIAAAGAGYLAGRPNINEPLTNKRLSGFTILRDKLYPPLVVEQVVSNGITMLEPVTGGGRVIWGKTTVNSNIAVEEEISIIFIRDRLAKSMRVAFRSYIGKAESPTFQSTLFAAATAMMQSFLGQRLITQFRNLIVERDAVEPRQWNVLVEVQPVFPVNWVYIRIDVGRF